MNALRDDTVSVPLPFRVRQVVPWLVAVLLLCSFIGLGTWQLHRAELKRMVMEDFARAMQMAPIPFASVDLPAVAATSAKAADWEALRYRTVWMTGTYLPDRQFLLDNQVHQNQVGYRVITPFQEERTGVVILVERGWMGRSLDRAILPEVATDLDATLRTVRGHLYVPYGEGYRLGPMDESTQQWPRIIQYLDFSAMGDRLGMPVLPLTLRLDPAEPQGYRRDWRPILPMGPEKHLAYAVQWFGLALALVVIAGVLVYRRRFSRE
jgi:surfeit locus 1 family protein